jgi:hypothetical protein
MRITVGSNTSHVTVVGHLGRIQRWYRVVTRGRARDGQYGRARM